MYSRSEKPASYYANMHPNDPANIGGDIEQARKDAFGDYVGDLLVKRDFTELALYTGTKEGDFMEWFMDQVEDGAYRDQCFQWLSGDSAWVHTTAYEVADDYFDYLEDGE